MYHASTCKRKITRLKFDESTGPYDPHKSFVLPRNLELLRCDEMLLEKEIGRDSHCRLMQKYKEETAILKKKIEIAEGGESNFMKYCRYGISLLSNLNGFYMDASVEIKQKLLGSIFPAKLHFRDDSYRTTPINPALSLILQKNKGLEKEKTGQVLTQETLPGDVPMAGLEPAPCKTRADFESTASTNFATSA